MAQGRACQKRALRAPGLRGSGAAAVMAVASSGRRSLGLRRCTAPATSTQAAVPTVTSSTRSPARAQGIPEAGASARIRHAVMVASSQA